jgi:hypothetical protein
MAYIPPTVHVTLLATLRRERMLPVPGEVLVAPGQRVEAATVVAQAIIPDEHRIIDVARELGVPNEKAAAFMVKQDGEPVKRGEAIAARRAAMGLGRRVVASPVSGSIVLSGGGQALVAANSGNFELRAGLPGTITNTLSERGVVVETTGALLEGVWGNGQDQFAVMRAIGSGPQETLLPEHIEVGLRGTLLAVGTLQDPAIFKQLTDTSIRGLILGSLRADLLPTLQKWNIPVLIVDGFGVQGFSLPAYTLLASNNGREVWLNACVWDRFANHRPEVIIPLPSPGQAPQPPADGEALQMGKRIRVVRGPLAGQAGTVTALSDRPMTMASGVRTRVATVEFEAGNVAPTFIPFANLEILE